jgi:hypothetical protein
MEVRFLLGLAKTSRATNGTFTRSEYRRRVIYLAHHFESILRSAEYKKILTLPPPAMVDL